MSGEAALVLSLGSGVSRFLLSAGPDKFGEGDEQTRSFVRRVEGALALHRRRGASNLAVLARSSRPTEKWLRDLSQLAEGRTTYRVAAVPADLYKPRPTTNPSSAPSSAPKGPPATPPATAPPRTIAPTLCASPLGTG